MQLLIVVEQSNHRNTADMNVFRINLETNMNSHLIVSPTPLLSL